MRLHAIKAGEGDGFLLESGDEIPRRILIDGGPATFWDDQVKPHLRQVMEKGGGLDVLLVSHVDTDHVMAPLDLLAELEKARADKSDLWPVVLDVWHNSFERSVKDPERVKAVVRSVRARAVEMGVAAHGIGWAFAGIAEGAALRRAVLRAEIEINSAFAGELLCADRLAQPKVELGQMSLEVIGPTAAQLSALETKWDSWIEQAHRRKFKDLADVDASIPNLSSVVIMAEEKERRVLLTGDARGDHIVEGLSRSGLLTDGCIHVAVLKVQHHGGHRNASADFYQKVVADIYVISSNGRHGNPHGNTLQWILEAAKAQDRSFVLVATYLTETLKAFVEAYPPEEHGYSLRVPEEDGHAVVIDV